MEVKIKIGDEIIDAKIVMMNGDMIVSPKVEEFKPKDGDIVSVNDGTQIFLCKNFVCGDVIYAYFGWDFTNNQIFNEGKWAANRIATEEEKQKLFYKLAEEGYEWKPDTKELVKLKWKPKIGEAYYRPNFLHCRFVCYSGTADYYKMNIIKDHINKGWVFKTEEECQAFCDKLNEAIEGVKL